MKKSVTNTMGAKRDSVAAGPSTWNIPTGKTPVRQEAGQPAWAKYIDSRLRQFGTR